MAGYFQATCQGYVLLVHVVPGASRTEVAGLHGDRLKVRVAAPPEKGAANAELLAFLAKYLGVSKKSLQLMGTQSRAKAVAIHDLSPEIRTRLQALWPAEEEIEPQL
jgi:uncharacterized protein (TIGR00251 family)